MRSRLAAAVAAAVTIALVWAAPRGFDITDEGLYLLSYSGDVGGFFPSQYDRVVRVLDGPGALGVVPLRLARIGVELAVAAMLAATASTVLRRSGRTAPSWPSLLPVVLAFGYLSHAWLPASPSYNTLSAALVATFVVVLCHLVTDPAGRPASAVAAGAGLGALATIQLFVKWPVALLLIALACAAVAVGAGWRTFRRSAGGAAAAAAAVVLLVTDLGIGPSLLRFEDLSSANEMTAEIEAFAPAASLRRYSTGTVEDLHELLGVRGAGLAVAGFLVVHGLGARRASTAVRLAAAAALAVTAAVDLVGPGLFTPTTAVVVVGPLAGITAAVVATRRWRLFAPHEGVVVPSVVLLVAPVLTAVGTSNGLLQQALTAAAPWGALVAMVVAAAARRHAAQQGLALGVAALVAVFGAHALRGTLRTPYRVPTALLAQTTSIPGPLGGVRVDPATAAFFTDLTDAVRRHTTFEPGDRALALSKVPGLLFAIGARPAGPAWIASPSSDQRPACRALDAAAEQLIAVEVVLVADVEIAPELDRCLRAAWAAWPDGLVEVDRIENPYARAAGLSGEVRVLVPVSAGP